MQGKTYKIPIYTRAGIAAYAEVDEIDWLWAHQFRWHLCNGYAARSRRQGGPKGKPIRIFMHREILGLKHGYRDKLVDHANGVPLDNRRANLRIATYAENGQNKASFKGSTSKYRGVSWYSAMGVWRVAIMVNGHRTLVGYYTDEDEAGRAASAFYAEHVPFARAQ